MSLSQAIVYYIITFFGTLGFIIAGCLVGVKLRNRKNAKLEAKNAVKKPELKEEILCKAKNEIR